MQVTMHTTRTPLHSRIALLLVVALECTTCMHSATAVIPTKVEELFLSDEASGRFSTFEHSGRSLMHEHSTDEHDTPTADHDHSTSTEDEYELVIDGHEHEDSDNATSKQTDHEHGSASTTASVAVADDSSASEASVEVEKTVVKTAEELESAVKRGDEHIELQKHLDLTGLEMKNCGGGVNCILGLVPSTVKSIRGNCQEDPTMIPPESTAALREFLPNQCMLIADVDLLKVKDSKLWIDQVYVRFSKSKRQPAVWSALAEGQFFHFIEVQGGSAEVWITSTTLQGDGSAETDCFFCGVAAWNNADVFVGGCMFADFDGDHTAGVSDGATLSFVDTYFRQNHLSSLYAADDDSHLSVVIADVGFSGIGNTAVRLEDCIFDRNTPVATPTLLAATPNATEHAVFYSDSSSPKVCEVDSTAWALYAPDSEAKPAAVECVYASTEMLDKAKDEKPGSSFLTADNAWLLAVMKETGASQQSVTEEESAAGMLLPRGSGIVSILAVMQALFLLLA